MNQTRTLPTTNVGQREAARRRIRRTTQGTRSLYCRTNGCTTYMERLSSTEAVCPICGARSRLH